MTALTLATTDARVMIKRSLRHSSRNIEALITAMALPIALLLLFVYVFGGAMATGTEHYVDYVVPGLILLCAGFGAGGTAVVVAMDLDGGFVNRLRAMALRRDSVLVGHVVASLTRNAVATTIVVAAGYGVGWRPSATPVEWLAAIGLVALFVLAISWLAAAVGCVVRTVDAANGFTFVLMFLPYISSAFVPTDTMSPALRAFAEHQPITPVIETLRGLWMGTAIGDDAWWALGWCVGLVVVSYGLARACFARRTAA